MASIPPDPVDKTLEQGISSCPSDAISSLAFHYRNYLLFWLGRLFSIFAIQIVAVAAGWHIYDLTRDPFNLGMVGLIQFLPAVALVLIAGSAADHINRQKIMSLSLIAKIIGAGMILFLVFQASKDVRLIYIGLLIFSIGRAFFGPASQALVPNLVPPHALANAIAWASTVWHIATIGGPLAGGLLYGISAATAYSTALIFLGFAMMCLFFIRKVPQQASSEKTGWLSMLAGLQYIGHHRLILGAISLDFFAVLLGGATALLPAVARDVLDVGPWGLGLLRAAPGIGAITIVALLSAFPIRNHAGNIMFASVVLFGISTILFGFSTLVWLSVAALAVMGAADMIGVVIRETLLQLWTPDSVRGRVNAINASSLLGEFRAGISASLMGVMPAIIFGGIGTVIVAALWAFWFPELRETRKLDAPKKS